MPHLVNETFIVYPSGRWRNRGCRHFRSDLHRASRLHRHESMIRHRRRESKSLRKSRGPNCRRIPNRREKARRCIRQIAARNIRDRRIPPLEKSIRVRNPPEEMSNPGCNRIAAKSNAGWTLARIPDQKVEPCRWGEVPTSFREQKLQANGP